MLHLMTWNLTGVPKKRYITVPLAGEILDCNRYAIGDEHGFLKKKDGIH